ncbi:site-specific integrase [Devosia sp. WQ 349]|uniref:tyrosine-type recombinase/integrase n=1 Tax=Devosia sp. WQ 349K1 TaxID=2800329 RepID=UPI0019063C82|nr:site-specific integrase [Devosia sp. WQ 349K1]MBK1793548.1 site-specific integrase [Devosia sp. WQ 349K1]
MPVVKLTRKNIEGLAPGVYYDTALKGFGLRISSAGGSWFIEYRPGAGGRNVAKKRQSIGKLDRLSPEQARTLADQKLAQVTLGADPAAAVAAARAAEKFEVVAARYVKEHVRTKRKAATADYYDYVIRLHIASRLGNKSLAEIDRPTVAAMHSAVGRDAGTYIANRALAIVSAVYNWADPDGRNPAKGVEKFPEEGRERYLTQEEIAALGRALREAETTGLPFEVDPAKPVSKHSRKAENKFSIYGVHVTNAVRLLMLTGCRVSEILELQWNEVDLQRGLLFLPDSKTGKKTVVLSEAAMDVLRSTPRIGKYVIASDTAGEPDEKPRADLKRPWAAIRRRAGLNELRLHDLRHTFASVGAGAGLGLPVIGKLLGHSSAKTTARYAHVAVDASKRAADSIAATIDGALKGELNGNG